MSQSPDQDGHKTRGTSSSAGTRRQAHLIESKTLAVEGNRDYHSFTDLDKEPGGLRRLDLIVGALENQRRTTENERLRVLDMGCGNGNINVPLASLGYEVVGIDSDPRSIQVARERSAFDNATFLVHDALALDGDDAFDAIVCAEVLEHLPQPLDLLGSVSALLDEEGVLLVTVPNGYTIEELLRRFLTRTRLGLSLRAIGMYVWMFGALITVSCLRSSDARAPALDRRAEVRP